jgi:hypothetical protein
VTHAPVVREYASGAEHVAECSCGWHSRPYPRGRLAERAGVKHRRGLAVQIGGDSAG